MEHLEAFSGVLGLDRDDIAVLRSLPMVTKSGGLRWHADAAHRDDLIARAKLRAQGGTPYNPADPAELDVPKFLAAWRELRGDTLKEVAARHGVTRSRIGQIEAPDKKTLRRDAFAKMIAGNAWRLPEGEDGKVRPDIADMLEALNQRAMRTVKEEQSETRSKAQRLRFTSESAREEGPRR
jgi:transcriptional regulator with XRE-family HTH domain